MKCQSPLQISRTDGFKQMVPCGHCLNCSIKRQMGWALRICLEASQHASSSFVTLTYDEAMRPGTLDYGHIQRFLRRWRKSTGPTRFFCVGEYGARTQREHWHLVMFGVPPFSQGATLIEQWPHGGVHCGEVNQRSAMYIGRYSLKTGGRHDSHYRCGRLMQASRKPGIGLDRMRQIGVDLARQKPIVERLPSWWRIGKTLVALDKTSRQVLRESYLAAGGVETRPDRSPLGYDMEAKLTSLIGDPCQVDAAQIRQIERRELEHGTF